MIFICGEISEIWKQSSTVFLRINKILRAFPCVASSHGEESSQPTRSRFQTRQWACIYSREVWGRLERSGLMGNVFSQKIETLREQVQMLGFGFQKIKVLYLSPSVTLLICCFCYDSVWFLMKTLFLFIERSSASGNLSEKLSVYKCWARAESEVLQFHL